MLDEHGRAITDAVDDRRRAAAYHDHVDFRDSIGVDPAMPRGWHVGQGESIEGESTSWGDGRTGGGTAERFEGRPASTARITISAAIDAPRLSESSTRS
jgi:hypothetical protein